MIDAVLSYHLTSLTCGTAKFNRKLADQLGVPCLSLDKHPRTYPLVSVKPDEIEDANWPLVASWYQQYDLLLHARPSGLCVNDIVRKARRVYAANPAIASIARDQTGRRDVQAIWCPSSLNGNPDRGRYRVLTYGMAHKLTAPYYEQLKALLDTAHPDYTISLSTAVHEGSPWDESLQSAAGLLKAIFGDRLRVLGYLADDALARELRECDAVALFYEPGLRSNNTTAWAALDAGKPLVTNTDEFSPPELCGRVINIAATRHWPFSHVLADCGKYGQQTAQAMGWDQLVGVLRA